MAVSNRDHIRKAVRVLLTALAAVLLMGMLSSCAQNDGEDQEGYLVYYVNAARDDIIYRPVKVNEDGSIPTLELISFLLDQMFHNTDLTQEHFFSAKPDKVEINNYNLTDTTLTFDFNEEYRNQTNVEEILLRASLVLTMIQVPNVTQVFFTVNGEPLTDSTGKEIGAMSASNFVNILLSEEGMLKQETDLTIYFTDETGTKLIPSQYHFTISNSNSSMEEYILQQIKAGPEIENTYRTMAPDVDILSVVTSDDVCYVNLGSNFLEQEQPVGDEILIYSIVNSLCKLDYVKSVQFLIDGSADVVLHTMIDLSTPFTPNKELEQ